MDRELKVKSLHKALQVLECFTSESPELGITEISEKLDLYKSNVHNIISTFEKLGYIEKNKDNDKYRLGLKILELAQVISSNISLRKVALPYMQQIADKTGEIVYLGIPSEGQVIYLDSACPRNGTPSRSMLGIRAPMYCTAIGKAMLAYLPENALTQQEMVRYTDNTLLSRDKLKEELKSIRENGFSLDNMEHEYGIKCIGAPIRSKKGVAVAGISISGPSLRFTKDHIPALARILLESTENIEKMI
ncbi:MAG TPA: IclR family transcriptional regulator [Prolixibacteraceae bacterium]|nr:IclR family transcriptional regulator [Prolixibacteraceae bacterium]